MELGESFYKKNDRRKYHIRCKLRPDNVYIIKYFGIHKRRWHYEVVSFYELDLCFKSGLWSKKRFK